MTAPYGSSGQQGSLVPPQPQPQSQPSASTSSFSWMRSSPFQQPTTFADIFHAPLFPPTTAAPPTHAQPSLSIHVPAAPTIPAELWTNREDDTATNAEENISLDSNAAEEDIEEAKRRREARIQQHRGEGSGGQTRLHVHPLAAATASSAASAATQESVDPVTAALLRQELQRHRGEPHSPLSPHTLQALYAASAEGRHVSFLAQLTPDQVVAPVPLALTWYPTVPPGVTQHADRKRSADGSTLRAMARHELSMFAEEGGDARGRSASSHVSGAEEAEDMDDYARRSSGDVGESGGQVVPPLRRPRVDFGVPPAPVPLPEAAHAASGEDATDDAFAGCEPRVDAQRKRGRGERVYEYFSHGRRLN